MTPDQPYVRSRNDEGTSHASALKDPYMTTRYGQLFLTRDMPSEILQG